MMTLAKPGPIATRLVREVRKVKGARVVDLRAFREGATKAAELQKSVASRDDLSDFHPAHALYVYVQNQVSVLAEQLTALPATSKLADRIEAAQDEYMPGGPPMSPLTTSYFTCWAFFDAAVGQQHETLGVRPDVGLRPCDARQAKPTRALSLEFRWLDPTCELTGQPGEAKLGFLPGRSTSDPALRE
ncbi:MAG: hypothetical protein HY906_23830 [Deltaproteobacteria bacterium]|nr:hypothetical protein [Deltaproteobacteria bacterium]